MFENMIGRSRAMLRVFDAIDRVAPTDVTVLVRGESGTGKELPRQPPDLTTAALTQRIDLPLWTAQKAALALQ